MKRIFLFATALLTSTVFFSCVDLNTEPQGDIITDTQKEEAIKNNPARAEAGVNAIFAQFSQYMPNADALGAARHNDIGYPTIMLCTDANGYDVVSEDNGYNWMGFDLDYSDRDFSGFESQMVWNNLYKMINTCNNVIVAIDRDTKDPKLQYYLGQGLATRSFCYWTLAQLYQFNYDSHQSAACVPIITDENANKAAIDGCKRNTVEEVYAQIESDINTAIDLLNSSSQKGIKRTDKRYINAAVAYGLRARINLTKHDYAAALSDANQAIALSDAKPAIIADVKKPTFMSAKEGNWMWGIIIAETDRVVTSGIVNWPSHMGSLSYGYANYCGGRQINKLLYSSIPATDVRKGWWIDEYYFSPNLTAEQQQFMDDNGYPALTQVKFAPYNNVVGTSVNANDIPLMRIEEMYLIKAEAEAMSGGNGKATLEGLIKTYRDPSYVCTASTPADVQEEVFRQRRIELWGEGLNWYDIMRLNKGVDRRGGGFPNATMVFNIPAGDNILLWRIPETEITANPMLQNSDNNPAVPAPTPVPDI